MTISVSLTEKATFKTLGDVLTAILPAGAQPFPVVLGQVNRVPQIKADDYAVMWPTRRTRLSTNEDEYDDCLFTGSITGTDLEVTEVEYGFLEPGRTIFGNGVLLNTTIVSGPSEGGPGSYVVSNSQTVGSEAMAGGAAKLTQHTLLEAQVDVHGPNSADNAQIISTIFRDEFGVTLFNPDVSGVTPLYADDPRQMPYSDEQAQVENRWIIEVRLQVNPAVVVPQQFAGELELFLVNVDEMYPDYSNAIGKFKIGFSRI